MMSFMHEAQQQQQQQKELARRPSATRQPGTRPEIELKNCFLFLEKNSNGDTAADDTAKPNFFKVWKQQGWSRMRATL